MQRDKSIALLGWWEYSKEHVIIGTSVAEKAASPV